MNTKLIRILDECIEQIHRGETIASCLSRYPQLQEQLEPLLKTAQAVSSLPVVLPSDEFRRASKARLMARIREEAIKGKTAEPGTTLLSEMVLFWQRIWQAFIGAKKVAVPVTLTLLLILAVGIPRTLNFLSATPALASQCTLSILSGSVEVQEPGADRSHKGIDGMTLTAGTRIKTAPSSHALLTFFEGSTFKLDPNSDVEVQKIENAEGLPVKIVLKQWLGRTWSRVVKMADPGSQYRINTPSATAVVRGTLFTTEVEESGLTKVLTTEGLVSVLAQGEEVSLTANQQTQVETGAKPSQPTTAHSPTAEIIITTNKPAVSSVTDPTGSSTGILPSGLSFNQILGSNSFFTSEAIQLITIAEPVTGEYLIVLRYLTEGQASFSVQGVYEGNTVFNYHGNWGGSEANAWLIHLAIQVENGQIVVNEITSVETLGEKAPEKIIETPLAIGEGTTTTIQDSDTEGKPDVDKGKPDKPEDKGQPGKPEDKGQPDRPGGKGEPDEAWGNGLPDEPEDKGQPGEPEGKGQPDKPEDKGKPDKPEDKGKPDKPEDKGKPDKPEDKGQPDKPEDKGKPDKSVGKGKPED